jgi:hypothetical protein
MKGTTSGDSITYEKFLDIKDYPDLFGARESLETTTLSDDSQTFEEGIRSQETLQFTHNYSLLDFQKVKALEGVEQPWAIWLGGTAKTVPTGSDGKFTLKGKISVTILGKGVNEVREMRTTITPSTALEEDKTI